MIFLRSAILAVIVVPTFAHADSRDLDAFDTGLENQAGLVFSPDGNTAFWTAWDGVWGAKASSPRTIYTSSMDGGEWSEPAVVPFSGRHNDDDPFASPDGRWLYFVSDRPESQGAGSDDGDIWRYSLSGDGRLEKLEINTDAEEYSPVVTESGALYFASARKGGAGRGDLYRSAPSGDGFAPPQTLGPVVNSATGEWNLWVAADESEILFEASSRPTNVSIPGDIYYSWRTPAGWTAAMPVSALNSEGSDLLPRLHPDGETLYYTRAPLGGHAKVFAVRWPPIREELRRIQSGNEADDLRRVP